MSGGLVDDGGGLVERPADLGGTGSDTRAQDSGVAWGDDDGSMGARAWLARALEARADLTRDPADRRAAIELAEEIGCVPVLRRLTA